MVETPYQQQPWTLITTCSPCGTLLDTGAKLRDREERQQALQQYVNRADPSTGAPERARDIVSPIQTLDMDAKFRQVHEQSAEVQRSRRAAETARYEASRWEQTARSKNDQLKQTQHDLNTTKHERDSAQVERDTVQRELDSVRRQLQEMKERVAQERSQETKRRWNWRR